MLELNKQKSAILQNVLPKIDNSIIELCTGEESITVTSPNAPILILHAALCEYGILPLSNEYISCFLGENTEIEKIPYEINGAILEKLLADRIKQFADISNTYIEISEYKKYSKNEVFKYFVDFLLDVTIPSTSDNDNSDSDNHIKIPLRLLLKNDTCLNTLLDKIKQLPDISGLNLDNVKMDLRFMIGYLPLNLNEIKSLKVGDALVPKKYYLSQKQLFVTNGEFSFVVEANDDLSELTLIVQPRIMLNDNKENNMTDNMQNNQLDLGKLSVNVQFILDTVPMSVDELSTLKNGSVIHINNNDLSDINIMVNNQKIATGRVISVNDEHLIQITDIKQ